MGLVQCCGIGDALAALFTRKRVDDEMGRADQPCVHRGSGLDGNQFIHQGLVNTRAKLTQRFGQHKVGLRGLGLVVSQATGIHDSEVGTQTVADVFI